MVETYQNLIGGRWQPAMEGGTFANENPARRGHTLGLFAAAGTGDALAALAAADAARRSWAGTDLTARQELVETFLALLAERTEELARIVTRENGKTIRESRAEIASALTEGRYHVRQASALLGHTLPGGTSGLTAWVRHEPVGVVTVISPWNSPVNVMCRKTLPALLTGNTVVFKPASFTPWSGVFMGRLFEEAGFPAGVFNCVTGAGSEVGHTLVGDERVRAVSFTGSTEVGKRIQRAAAANLTRTQLELGGKNAAIILKDADLDAALQAVMTAGLTFAGQWCLSTSRVLVQRDVAATFTERLVEACAAWIVNDPMEEDTQMGPVAGPRQFESISAAIEKASAEGAQLRVGGAAGPDLTQRGYYILPTVFSGVTPGMSIFRDEIFGPVLAVTEVADLDQALALANDSQYGLSSALFTRDIEASMRYVREIEAGLAHVNVHSGLKDPSLPFGGSKQSGYGPPENGRTGLEFFIDRKAVYIAS